MIDKLIEGVLAREGGYVNDPRDAGGETNLGITVATARANGYTGPMKSLTKATAAAIYKSQYYLKPGFDKVAAIYPRVADELFDTGINMGTTPAGRFLQRALNALNGAGLAVNGAVGKASLDQLLAFKAKRGAAGEVVLLKALDALQGERYIELAEGREANRAFLYGWLANRIGNA